MKLLCNRLNVPVLCFALLIFMIMLCGMRPFGRPPGTVIGSCKGSMRLATGEKVRFVFDVIKHHEDDIGFYVSIPRKGVRYMTVEDISFDDGSVRIEGKSPHRVYEGMIIGNGLTVEGQWKDYKGSFTLDIKE